VGAAIGHRGLHLVLGGLDRELAAVRLTREDHARIGPLVRSLRTGLLRFDAAAWPRSGEVNRRMRAMLTYAADLRGALSRQDGGQHRRCYEEGEADGDPSEPFYLDRLYAEVFRRIADEVGDRVPVGVAKVLAKIDEKFPLLIEAVKYEPRRRK
jgi:hypothetical protein